MSVQENCPHCSVPNNRWSDKEWRSLPTDYTEGRYAEVSITECEARDRLWLCYRVEYEAFSQSGRWACGTIDRETAKTIRSEDATALLESLPSYVRGGSYYDGKISVISGAMRWSA